MSIYTCGKLGRCDEARLSRKFGIIGRRLKEMGQGIDNSQVISYGQEDDVKSVGHSSTLERDIDDPVEIRWFLLQLSEMVGSRARRYGVAILPGRESHPLDYTTLPGRTRYLPRKHANYWFTGP
jgi:DNA polymerase-4